MSDNIGVQHCETVARFGPPVPLTRRTPPPRAPLLLALVTAWVTSGPASAQAENFYRLQPGETLAVAAQRFGCSLAAVFRANRVDTTLLPAGTRVRIPDCTRKAARPASAATRARSGRTLARAPQPQPNEPDHSTALAASATPVTRPAPSARAAPSQANRAATSAGSVGVPWRGWLRGAVPLPTSDHYLLRRPTRAWGAPHAVAYVTDALAQVRQAYPTLPVLAIGDMSRASGGRLTEHKSHQNGLDIDIGLYFTQQPENYPQAFAPANEHLDVAATWALVAAFANTAGAPDGVRYIFLDHAVAGRIYDFAKQQGVDPTLLDQLFEYPHGKRAGVGLVRHEPNHKDHLHIRFACAPQDAYCR